MTKWRVALPGSAVPVMPCVIAGHRASGTGTGSHHSLDAGSHCFASPEHRYPIGGRANGMGAVAAATLSVTRSLAFIRTESDAVQELVPPIETIARDFPRPMGSRIS